RHTASASTFASSCTRFTPRTPRWPASFENNRAGGAGFSRQRKGEDTTAGGHGHHLLAIHRVGHGAARHVAAQIDPPKLLAGLRVQRIEVAFHVLAITGDPAAAAAKHQLARR